MRNYALLKGCFYLHYAHMETTHKQIEFVVSMYCSIGTYWHMQLLAQNTCCTYRAGAAPQRVVGQLQCGFKVQVQKFMEALLGAQHKKKTYNAKAKKNTDITASELEE